jgi:hypothetical protein
MVVLQVAGAEGHPSMHDGTEHQFCPEPAWTTAISPPTSWRSVSRFRLSLRNFVFFIASS